MRLRFPHLAAAAIALAVATQPTALRAQNVPTDRTEAAAAFEDGRYDDAARLWERLAEAGDPEAASKLAQLYRLGLGVRKSNSRAFELYKIAAERGVAPAQVNLAFLLLTGEGVEKDQREAARWFAKAADKGDALAQFNLGLMYEKGVGVKADPALAKELYQLAAAQGQKRALSRLDAMESQLPPNGAVAEKPEPKPSQPPEKADSPEKTAEAEAVKKAEAEKKARAGKQEKPPKPGIRRSKPEPEKPDADAAANEPVLSIKRADPAPEPTPRSAPKDPEPRQPAPEMAEKDAETPSPPISTTMATPKPKPKPVLYETEAERAAQMSANSQVAMAAPVVKPQPPAAEALVMNAPAAIRVVINRMRDAERDYDQGRYSEAAEVFMEFARQGVPRAEFWMGRLYNRGEGVELDRFEAYSLWRSAAAKGNGPAATALANLSARLTGEELAAAEAWHGAQGRAR